MRRADRVGTKKYLSHLDPTKEIRIQKPLLKRD